MNLLRRIWRRLRARPRDVEVVKPSARAERLAALLRGNASLGADARRAVEQVTASMNRRSDPHPDPRYGTVARHFAGSSSGEPKLALLQQLIGYRGARSVLEVGTAYGLSSIAIATSKQRPSVVTIDFPEPQASIGPENLRSVGATNVECIKQDKVEALPRLAAEGRKFDFVFHDGGHTGDWYVSDFATIAPMLEPESVYVIDDIAWDRTPEIRAITQPKSRRTCFEGWQELLADPKVDGAVVINGNVGILLTR
jgi:predicted O-methyltransferase YrrM